MPPTGCSIVLPRRVMAHLLVFCARHGEQPADVVADAVALHLDALELDLSRIAAPAAIGATPERPAPPAGQHGDAGDHRTSARPASQAGRPQAALPDPFAVAPADATAPDRMAAPTDGANGPAPAARREPPPPPSDPLAPAAAS
jgi:hypothetical protein